MLPFLLLTVVITTISASPDGVLSTRGFNGSEATTKAGALNIVTGYNYTEATTENVLLPTVTVYSSTAAAATENGTLPTLTGYLSTEGSTDSGLPQTVAVNKSTTANLQQSLNNGTIAGNQSAVITTAPISRGPVSFRNATNAAELSPRLCHGALGCGDYNPSWNNSYAPRRSNYVPANHPALDRFLKSWNMSNIINSTHDYDQEHGSGSLSAEDEDEHPVLLSGKDDGYSHSNTITGIVIGVAATLGFTMVLLMYFICYFKDITEYPEDIEMQGVGNIHDLPPAYETLQL